MYFFRSNLFVHPGVGRASPARHTFGEPKSNFLLSRFNRVTSMANVTTNFNAEISTDGSHGRIRWHGGSKHLSAFHDGILAFPDLVEA